jgi:hypothetical protein
LVILALDHFVLGLLCRYRLGTAAVEDEAPLSRPIDNGQVDQTVVEYAGNRLGAATYRGPSGRQYRFDAGPWDRRHYVLAEDLGYFRHLVDFRVLEETRIDPQEQRLRALIAEAVERQKAEIAVGPGMASEPDREPEATRRASKRGGRRPGRGFGAWLDCLMYCGGVEGRYGSAKEIYDAIDGYLREHTPPDQYIPPRERFASMRSDAKVKREKAGRCMWHNHPEALPGELIPV